MAGHLCCLGIATAIASHVHTPLNKTELLNPVFLTLALKDYPDLQFKPPKRHLQT
jgi:hypothetical protein